ncbi:hypothetical protein LPJ75_005781, partial [Coemansia sp. RSA 2598]
MPVSGNELGRDTGHREHKPDNQEVAAKVPVEVTPESAEVEYEEQSPLPESQRTYHPHPVYLFMGPLIASLIFFSMVGVLVRVHLNKLFSYPGQPIYSVIWTQMLGCFIMGVAMRTKGALMSFSPALNVGVTTGL